MPRARGDKRTAKFKKGVLDNLRDFLNERGGFSALYRNGWFPEGTVKTWSGRGSVPSLEQAAQLGSRTGLSLDWLVTGKGPELRGATAPGKELADTLRAHILAALTPELGPAVAVAVPQAAPMLAEVLELYRGKTRDALRIARTGLVVRSLREGMRGEGTGDAGARLAAMLEAGSLNLEQLDALNGFNVTAPDGSEVHGRRLRKNVAVLACASGRSGEAPIE
jgi:hypothetical protein